MSSITNPRPVSTPPKSESIRMSEMNDLRKSRSSWDLKFLMASLLEDEEKRPLPEQRVTPMLTESSSADLSSEESAQNKTEHVVKKHFAENSDNTVSYEQDPSPISFLIRPSEVETSSFKPVSKDPYSKKRTIEAEYLDNPTDGQLIE
ncbi:MAG: hypothetical protein WCT85_00110 [Parachlamydiales bacterium]|jgi:hypothetical protein